MKIFIKTQDQVRTPPLLIHETDDLQFSQISMIEIAT